MFNRNRKNILFFLMLAVIFAVNFFISRAQDYSSDMIISGRVLDDNNNPIDGEYEVRFAIYTKDRTDQDPYPSDSDSKERVWEETQTVQVSGGIFNAKLGAINPLSGDLALNKNSYFVGIRIGKNSESVPRRKIFIGASSCTNGYFSQCLGSAVEIVDGNGKVKTDNLPIGSEQGNLVALDENGKINFDYLYVSGGQGNLLRLNAVGKIDPGFISEQTSLLDGGVIDIIYLPTGTGDDELVLGDDERLHNQNTDTGTDSNKFNIGNDSGLSHNFSITVSNDDDKPALRYNGDDEVWEYSNDGSTFSEFGSVSSGNFLPTIGGTMTGNIAFNSTQTFGGSTLTELGYLNGLLFSAGSILYGSDSDSLTALTGVSGDDAQYLRFNWNGGVPTLSWETVSGGGSFNNFILSGDSGTNQTIDDGNTLEIAGGTNIATVAGVTDTMTINLDSILTGVTWNGNAIDVSSYTNLSGDTEIVLTGDALSIASTIARDSELHSAITMSGSYDYITLSGQDIVRGQVDLATDVSGILPIANGGSGTSSALTQGSVVFAGASGVYSQDNANLFWDDTNNRLGIGDATPTENLTVAGSASVSTQFTATDYLGIKIDDPMVEDSLKIGNPTHIDSLREILNHDLSAGTVHDGGIVNNGDGTVSIAAGTAMLRSSADSHADMYSIEFSAQNNIALTDNSINYIYLDYNAGSPVFNVTTSVTDFNCQDKCLTYTIVREGTVLYIVDAREQNVDANRKHRRMLLETEPFRHVVGGTALGASGTRNISVTAGAFYYGLNRLDHGAFDTSVASTFDYYYRNGSGGWTKVTGQTQINNLQYDNGTGTLATLSGGRYGVHWVYMLNNSPSTLAVQYGQGDYTSLANARASTVPTAPPAMQGVGALIGRIIIQKSDAAFTSIDSALTQTFSPSAATTHNGLSGLQGGVANEYYHLTSAEYTGTGTGNFVRATSPILAGNVGIGVASPTARLHLDDGTATAGTAPLKFTAGINLTTPEAGAVEFDGTNLYFTDSVLSRKTIATTSSAHDAVTLAGSYDYLTLSAQQITLNQIDLATDVSGILPVANGGSGTSTAFTQGSLVFAGASGVYSQDNANLFWDDTNNELGIGTATPAAKLDVAGDMIISGTDAYLNFGSASGTLGYGIRDNAGDMEYKNSSGVWTGFDATSVGLAEDSFVNAGNLLADSNFLSQSVVLGDYIYLFGGTAVSGTKSNIYRAPISNPLSWTDTGSVLPAARAGAQIKVIGDYIYMFGGNNSAGSPVNTIYRATTIDPLTWVDTGSTLPGVLSISHVEIIGSNVYLFGGYNGAYTNVIYSATTADPLTWSNTGSTLPSALAGSSLRVIGDYIYLFGGRTGASSYTNVIYRAATATPTTWASTGSTLPSALHLSSFEIIGDYAYLFGGRTGSSTYTNKIYRAQITDPTTWSDTGSVLPSVLQGAQSEVINASVYLFGGSNGTNALSTIYVGTLSTCQSCIADADADTKIQTEASADEDKIRFYTAGVERMAIDQNGNLGLGTATFGTGAAGVFAIANGTIPSTSITNGVQLYAEDVTASSELKVRDEAGNITTLSPHNFSLIGEPSEDLAWSFYSERGSMAINVDMTKVVRLMEELTGEQLVYLKNLDTGEAYNDENIEYGNIDILNRINEQNANIGNILPKMDLYSADLDDFESEANEKIISLVGDLQELNDLVDDNESSIKTIQFDMNKQDGLINEIQEQMDEILKSEEEMRNLLSVFSGLFGEDSLVIKNIEAEKVKSKEFIFDSKDEDMLRMGDGKICAIVLIDENEDYLDDCSGNAIPVDADGDGIDDATKKEMLVDEDDDWMDDETGEGIVNDGTLAIIKTGAVKNDSKIYITPVGDPGASVMYVGEIKPNESFEVRVNEPVQKEIRFNWIIFESSEE